MNSENNSKSQNEMLVARNNKISPRMKAKVAKRWVGPYVIYKRTDINNYMIHKMNEETPKSFIIDTHWIKPYLRIQDRFRNIPPTSDNNNMVSQWINSTPTVYMY